MEAETILERIRKNEDIPANWSIFPLLRDKVLWAIAGWTGGALMGLILLILIVPQVIPQNYQRSAGSAIFTTIVLGVLLFVTLGSLWFLLHDVLRLRDQKRHIIVFTDKAFLKQSGDKLIYVPMEDILYVTSRGRQPEEPIEPPPPIQPTSSGAMLGSMFGVGRGSSRQSVFARRRRMRSPTSVAFIDRRTNHTITVVSDATHGDPFTIASLLKEYVQATQQM